MNKTKLIKILHSLSKKEFEQLGLFLSSPLFLQKNQDVLDLYIHLKKYWEDLQQSDKPKKFFFKLVYPTLAFDDLKMRHLLNKAVKSVDNYLIYLYNEEHELEREIQVTKIYNQRNNYSEFAKNTKRLLKKLEKKDKKDTKYYYHKYFLESSYVYNLSTKKEKEIIYYNNAINSFHNYIALEHTNFQIYVKNVKRIFDVEIDDTEIVYSKELTSHNTTHQLLKLTNELLASGKKEKLLKLRTLFEKNIGQLEEIDKKNIFFALSNVSIQKISENPSVYYPFLFEVYKLGIKHHLILNNGKIGSATYRNIVKIGLTMKNLDWAKRFIHEYEGKIEEGKSEYTKNSSLAYLYFTEESYEKVISLLSKMKFTEIKNSINLRTLLIRSSFKQYQKGAYKHQSLLTLLDSFVVYLKRDKSLIPDRKLKNKNFIKYLRKIIYLTERKKWNEKRATDLLNEIDQRKDIALSTWLKEVILKEIPTNKQLVETT